MGSADMRQPIGTIVSSGEKHASPQKARQTKGFRSGTHLARKLFCVSGKRLGLGTGGRNMDGDRREAAAIPKTGDG
jgi:hypothetical protein